MFGVQPVPPGAGVGGPYAKPDGYQFGFAVDHQDLFGVAARDRPIVAFALHPLCEGCEASLEGLLCLARALRRSCGCWGGGRRFERLYAQPGQSLLL